MIPAPAMKRCSTCGEALPATLEFFPPDARRPGGLAARCRACRSIAKRRRRTCTKCGERPAEPWSHICVACGATGRDCCQVGACTAPLAHPAARWCDEHAGPWGDAYADLRRRRRRAAAIEEAAWARPGEDTLPLMPDGPDGEEL